MFEKTIQQDIAQFHLLKHDFYQKWSEGKLKREELQEYSCQYFYHVNAFPRYISAIHSQCADISNRQVLLDNLIDEEKGSENHPELWQRFAEGIGVNRERIAKATLNRETKELIDGFFTLCRGSYAKGLGALYAYEYQVPEVATSKIDGLKKFYGLDDPKYLKFFQVHITADEWHSQECINLLNKLSSEEQEEARRGAGSAAKLLWRFLDGVNKIPHYC